MRDNKRLPGPNPRPAIDRVMERTARRPSGCLEWTGFVNQTGYGQVAVGTEYDGDIRQVGAHRVVMEDHLGHPIPDGLIVRHKCDNRRCVEATHLELGTTRDNSRDMVTRGRSNRGVKNGKAKLSEDQVRAARQRVAAGDPLSAIANEYGVTYACIYELSIGRTWRHIA